MFAGRLKAVAWVAEGMTVMDAAAKADVSVSRLTDWVKRCVEEGPGALRMPAGNMKIVDRQLLGLVRELVARGPARAPGKVSLWTVAELRAELWNVLRLRYSRDGIKGLMKRLGYSWPKRRPGRQRREALGLRLKAIS